jgi:hypothetical protein
VQVLVRRYRSARAAGLGGLALALTSLAFGHVAVTCARESWQRKRQF